MHPNGSDDAAEAHPSAPGDEPIEGRDRRLIEDRDPSGSVEVRTATPGSDGPVAPLAAPGTAAGLTVPDTPAEARGGRLRRLLAVLVSLTKAVADLDPKSIESTAVQFGNSRPYLAPIAWAAGTLVLLLRGVKLLILNWRLLLIQLVPAAWIWIAMYDLKQHGLRGAPFRDLNAGAVIVLSAIAIAWTIAAFWCNTVFAYAIDVPPPPLIRPAVHQTNKHWGAVLSAGLVVGGMLAGAAVVVPRTDHYWLFVVTLGGVLGVMFISFVAVPARIIGRRPQKLPPREAIGRTATGWAVSAVAMTPGFLLDRLGLLIIAAPGFHVIGFVLLSIGTALYAAGMSSVKAVKLSIKLGSNDPDLAPSPADPDSTPAPSGRVPDRAS